MTTTPFSLNHSDTPTADAYAHLMERFGDDKAQALLDIVTAKQLGLIRRGQIICFLANRAWNGTPYTRLVEAAQRIGVQS